MNQNHVIDGWVAQLRFDSRPRRPVTVGVPALEPATGGAALAGVEPIESRSRLGQRPRRRALRLSPGVRPCLGL